MLSLHTRGPPLSPCSEGEKPKVLLGVRCQQQSWLLSPSSSQSTIHSTEKVCLGSEAYSGFSGRRLWAWKVGLSLSPLSLVQQSQLCEEGCSRCGSTRHQEHCMGSLGSLGDVGQGGPGQGPADGKGEVSCGSGGDSELEGWFTCAGVCLGYPRGSVLTCSMLLPGRCQCHPAYNQHTSCGS